MKKILLLGLISLSLLLLSINTNAQAPTVLWHNLYPGASPVEDHLANMIMEDPYGGIVIVGNKRFPSQTNPHNEVLVIRADKDGYPIWIKSFGGTKTDSVWNENTEEYDISEYPWDQEAYDMVMNPEGNYLITGFRDTTSYSAASGPGVFLLEISPAGQVITDTLYYNDNLDKLYGHSIRSAPGGEYIIAGEINQEDVSGDQIMMISLKKDDHGNYDNVGLNLIQVNEVEEGISGYAKWVRPFEDGYLVAGQCRNDGQKMFLQKVDEDRFPEWTYYYGDDSWFADGVIMGDTIYLAGYMAVPVEGSFSDQTQVYIVKIDREGTVIWEKTYGGNRTVYSKTMDVLVDGNLMIGAQPLNASYRGEIALLKVDAVTGDSLYMENYGTYYSAGITAACPTANFEYLTAARASASATQDRRILVTRYSSSSTEASLSVAKEDLHLAIDTDAPTKDVIDVTAEKIYLFGICVKIDSLIHPKVSDLELSLEHDGTTVTLVNQALLSGENFIRTNFIDGAENRLIYAPAPYTGWFPPEDPLSPFRLHSPTGEWTLTITDHGTGALKATTGMLEGWSLNLLTESSAVGTPTIEMLANFGLEPISPNPVSQEARITFRIPEPAAVNLKVYNQLGQEVASLVNEDLPKGLHSKIWNPGSLAPGTYFVHLESAGMVSVRKAILSR